MKVLGTLIRVFIERDAMDETIKFYEELYQTSCTQRGYYEVLNLELAIVDKAVIIAGDAASRKVFESARATLLVDSIQDAMNELQQRGAVCLTKPKRTPGSWIMLMQHPDGLIAEYVERIS
ncbi:glyoxalase/bleomycin resistance/dioxygenase family protein [Sporolactobacillus shoreae]|uniref:Glyoxalase/bleomycin resistance/dioxygenase family protein n=1 Tax=Sporolactobacillus shoreae TaxID=1465501 RepID=A0A4Z0GKJ9_9BACL|nr:glyoxalase/bleomycin resistance/dioxygenase family protein [Sporolactobacillus shoreae]TGA96226.1 glyoxalase/bleomycin resistance/dioxygenase family protein [Sporolactobacillus shoreae]